MKRLILLCLVSSSLACIGGLLGGGGKTQCCPSTNPSCINPCSSGSNIATGGYASAPIQPGAGGAPFGVAPPVGIPFTGGFQASAANIGVPPVPHAQLPPVFGPAPPIPSYSVGGGQNGQGPSGYAGSVQRPIQPIPFFGNPDHSQTGGQQTSGQTYVQPRIGPVQHVSQLGAPVGSVHQNIQTTNYRAEGGYSQPTRVANNGGSFVAPAQEALSQVSIERNNGGSFATQPKATGYDSISTSGGEQQTYYGSQQPQGPQSGFDNVAQEEFVPGPTKQQPQPETQSNEFVNVAQPEVVTAPVVLEFETPEWNPPVVSQPKPSPQLTVSETTRDNEPHGQSKFQNFDYEEAGAIYDDIQSNDFGAVAPEVVTEFQTSDQSLPMPLNEFEQQPTAAPSEQFVTAPAFVEQQVQQTTTPEYVAANDRFEPAATFPPPQPSEQFLVPENVAPNDRFEPVATFPPPQPSEQFLVPDNVASNEQFESASVFPPTDVQPTNSPRYVVANDRFEPVAKFPPPQPSEQFLIPDSLAPTDRFVPVVTFPPPQPSEQFLIPDNVADDRFESVDSPSEPSQPKNQFENKQTFSTNENVPVPDSFSGSQEEQTWTSSPGVQSPIEPIAPGAFDPPVALDFNQIATENRLATTERPRSTIPGVSFPTPTQAPLLNVEMTTQPEEWVFNSTPSPVVVSGTSQDRSSFEEFVPEQTFETIPTETSREKSNFDKFVPEEKFETIAPFEASTENPAWASVPSIDYVSAETDLEPAQRLKSSQDHPEQTASSFEQPGVDQIAPIDPHTTSEDFSSNSQSTEDFNSPVSLTDASSKFDTLPNTGDSFEHSEQSQETFPAAEESVTERYTVVTNPVIQESFETTTSFAVAPVDNVFQPEEPSFVNVAEPTPEEDIISEDAGSDYGSLVEERPDIPTVSPPSASKTSAPTACAAGDSNCNKLVVCTPNDPSCGLPEIEQEIVQPEQDGFDYGQLDAIYDDDFSKVGDLPKIVNSENENLPDSSAQSYAGVRAAGTKQLKADPINTSYLMQRMLFKTRSQRMA